MRSWVQAQLCVDVTKEEEDVLLFCFNWEASHRLKEYWMTEEDYNKFEHELIDFAKQTEVDPGRAHRRVVPTGIDLKVCTLQQEGEQVGSALERAIRAEKLIPLYLFPFQTWLLENGPLPPIPLSDLFLFFLWDLERIRVEDVGEGLAMMRDCGVCLRAPVLGDQISVLPACGHAFHSHCIVGSLLEKRECPLCRCLVTYDPMSAFADYEQVQAEISEIEMSETFGMIQL